MIVQECRRCYGRRYVDGELCFVCLGKGRIEIPDQQLHDHFREYREKSTEPDE